MKFIGKILLLLYVFSLFSCFESEIEQPKPFETDTMIDNDGKTYKTIKIGDQWWMMENLASEKFANGDLIEDVKDKNLWSSSTNPAFCRYENSIQKSGLLYNFKVISDSRKIPPAGWHIPTDDDWKKLEKFLGMSDAEIEKINFRGTNEGNSLKADGNQGGWTIIEGNYPTNESGFSALGGGCRLYNGKFSVPGINGGAFFWTSTSYSGSYHWIRHLDYKSSKVFRYYVESNYGCNIRLVKD